MLGHARISDATCVKRHALNKTMLCKRRELDAAMLMIAWALSLPLAWAACYTPAFQDPNQCCVSNLDRTTVLDAKHAVCTYFGHHMIASSEYLRPGNYTGMPPDHAQAFQEAFFKQGIFNTVTYRDCDTTWLGVTVRQPTQAPAVGSCVLSLIGSYKRASKRLFTGFLT